MKNSSISLFSIITLSLFILACSNQSSHNSEYKKEILIGKWDATDVLSDDMILNADGTGEKGNPALTGYHDISWSLVKDSLIIDSEFSFKKARYKIEELRDTIVAGKHIYGLFLSTINEDGNKIEEIYRRIE